jgi:flavin reductase (DIM6/NTAB) family NADH-FMN oxidoreductase RutF
MQPKSDITKQSWKPGNMLSPVPAVLVSCGGTAGWEPNLITIAWAGSVCTNPPMLSISVRPERHSFNIIKQTGEFVVNLPTVDQAKATDWCGIVSGRDNNKFKKTGLTAAPSLNVRCPIVLECPVNIECRVKKILKLGSHTMFIAEVVGVQISDSLLDRKGKLCLEKAGLVAFMHGEYFELGPAIGHFGFSVRKKKPAVKKAASKTRKPHERNPRKPRT